MRYLIFTGAALLGACVQHGPAHADAASPRVAYGDLLLDSSAGRAELRARVAREAKDYCAAHGAEITPHASRADRYYCLDAVRFGIMDKLPEHARRAYARARREAGVRGRRL